MGIVRDDVARTFHGGGSQLTRWHCWPALLLLAGLGQWAGCSNSELPGRDARVPESILVLPATAKLTFRDGKIQTQQFTACVKYSADTADLSAPTDATMKCGAGQVDVTDKVLWVVEESTMGRFDDATKGRFSTEVLEQTKPVPATHGGKTRILAKLAGREGSADLTVLYYNDFFGTGTTSATRNLFKGAKSGTFAVYYPPNLVLLPPNLGQMEVHYQSSTAHNVFMVRFYSDISTVRLFTTDPRFLKLDLKQWAAVGLTNMGQKVMMDVWSTSTTASTTNARSSTYTLLIAESKIRGGLYYWDTTKPEGIYRYDFEKPTSAAEAYYTRKEANDCVGCHAVSRGGKLVGFTKSGGSGMTDIFDTKTRTSVVNPGGKYRGDIQTFGPKGEEVIVAHQGILTRREVKSGKELEKIRTSSFDKCSAGAKCNVAGEVCKGVCSKTSFLCTSSTTCPKGETCGTFLCRGNMATHPDWSPDGTKLVYAASSLADYHSSDKGFKIPDDVHFKNGSVYLIERSSSGSWKAPELLVKGGNKINYYYPTFSPQGDWIAFNRSTGDSYADFDASVWVTSTKPISGKRITKNLSVTAGSMAKSSNSWPRWSPFIQQYSGQNIYWLTFSSVRDYGLRLRNSSVSKYEDKAPQVWMVPFDTSRALKGQDPTPWPPFWLPFQNYTHHNHIAQWTEKVLAVQ